MPVAVNFTPSQDPPGVTTIPVPDFKLFNNGTDVNRQPMWCIYFIFRLFNHRQLSSLAKNDCRKASVKYWINPNPNIAYKYIISETSGIWYIWSIFVFECYFMSLWSLIIQIKCYVITPDKLRYSAQRQFLYYWN